MGKDLISGEGGTELRVKLVNVMESRPPEIPCFRTFLVCGSQGRKETSFEVKI